MERVGLLLQTHAVAAVAAEQDVFARSAYNRYYYAMFLMARSLIGSISSGSMPTLGHKGYPDYLRNNVAKAFKLEIRKALKNSDGELVGVLKRAEAATQGLANQMERANAVRIVADYKPEIPVVFEQSTRFKLQSTPISDAHSWVQHTKSYVNIIQAAWAQVNV